MLRYFLTYRGVKLPLCLTEELQADALNHRNTYIRAEYDAQDRLCWLEKLVYGEVELRHDYRYNEAGKLIEARIQMLDEDVQMLHYTD